MKVVKVKITDFSDFFIEKDLPQ